MTQITDFADGGSTISQVYNPVLSPDGTKILFNARNASTGYWEVWVVNNQGASTATVLVSDASNYVRYPAWSSDSDTFVYTHQAGGLSTGGTIYKDTVSSPGSPVALKAAAGGYSPYRAQVSYDGTRVAYIWDQDVGVGHELRCMDIDGTNDIQLDSNVSIAPDPPGFSWALTQNVLAYDKANGGSNPIYVINDDGTGKTQINANGDAAGAACLLSHLAWAPADAFVVLTCNIGSGFWNITRAEVDGSDTTIINFAHGPVNQNNFKVALVASNRIWFIEQTSGSAGEGWVASVAIDGTGYTKNFDSSDGSGDQVGAFSSGGDGWYFN